MGSKNIFSDEKLMVVVFILLLSGHHRNANAESDNVCLDSSDVDCTSAQNHENKIVPEADDSDGTVEAEDSEQIVSISPNIYSRCCTV